MRRAIFAFVRFLFRCIKSFILYKDLWTISKIGLIYVFLRLVYKMVVYLWLLGTYCLKWGTCVCDFTAYCWRSERAWASEQGSSSNSYRGSKSRFFLGPACIAIFYTNIPCDTHITGMHRNFLYQHSLRYAYYRHASQFFIPTFLAIRILPMRFSHVRCFTIVLFEGSSPTMVARKRSRYFPRIFGVYSTLTCVSFWRFINSIV